MKLSERLRQAEVEQAATLGVLAMEPPSPATRLAGPSAPGDGLSAFKSTILDQLFERLGQRLFDQDTSEEQLQAQIVSEIEALMQAAAMPLSGPERQRLVLEICSDVIGLGPIERLLRDPSITEIMVNGCRSIFVERAGVIEETTVRFATDEQLRRTIDRIVGQVGRRIDESSPMVDARLPDGSRVNAIIPPLAVDGPALTIRRFGTDPLQVDDLLRLGSLSEPAVAVLSAAVAGGLNVLISGGTGTGKTTLLNVLSSFVPGSERIVTIEDAVELQLRQRHVVRLEARPPNIEGRGEVTIRDLVRNALRMRPDRIIVGEVRGAEALDMLQAMNTGHDGSLSTVHANSPRDAVTRLETMVLMAGLELPSRAIREQIASAIDVVVQLDRSAEGQRRVTHITEVVGMEGDVVTMQDVYRRDVATGRLLPTGLRPLFAERLAAQRIVLPPEVFGGLAAVGDTGWGRR